MTPRPWPGPDECLRAMRGGDGAGVTIAVLDTGIDPGHPDFHSLRLTGNWRVAMNNGTPQSAPAEGADPVGHGTGVAGIIHALAPQAEIVAVAVLGTDQRQCRHEIIRHGARLAIDQGAAVLNCSFGVPAGNYTLPIYKEWTDEAFHRNRIVVAASPNDAPELEEWPAFFAQVIAVAAAEGSQCLPPASNDSGHITVAAPGDAIRVPQPGGGHAILSGSSFAAPHVTGLLARLLSAFPDLPPSIAREAVVRLAAVS